MTESNRVSHFSRLQREGLQFYRRYNSIMQRWPTPSPQRAGFSMPSAQI
jgi:hypothetical protein